MTTQSMYAELLKMLSDQHDMSRRGLARRAGLHHNTVIRILDNGGDAGLDVMIDIGRAIGADPVRALVAVLVMQDPNAYFSPQVRVISELITTLSAEFSALDSQLFDGFVKQEFSSLVTLILRAVVPALERRDRRMAFL